VQVFETASILAFAAKNYGRPVDVDRYVAAYTALLQGRYTAAQVSEAMLDHATRSSDMPHPSDLVALIEPPATRITDQQAAAARRALDAQGYYNAHSCEAQLLRDYAAQQASEYKGWERRQQLAANQN
jgi:hypothetical protein